MPKLWPSNACCEHDGVQRDTEKWASLRSGRFYAGVQIVVGFFLLLWLLLFWNQLHPNVRRMMIIGVAVGLPLGYGLWKRTGWALYLLTLVFVIEIGIWMAGFRHGHLRPVLAFYLHALMMYYCWKRQPDFA